MQLNGILFNHSFSSENCFDLLGFLSFPHSVHGYLIKRINLIKSGPSSSSCQKNILLSPALHKNERRAKTF